MIKKKLTKTTVIVVYSTVEIVGLVTSTLKVNYDRGIDELPKCSRSFQLLQTSQVPN